MPTRGYRKGISDNRQPHPHVMKTRTTPATYHALRAEAQLRGVTLSALLSAILDAHIKDMRLEAPHARSTDAALIHQPGRIGNNLNQIAHQAHLMQLHLLQTETRATLVAVNAAIERR